MKIILLDRDNTMVDAWKDKFRDYSSGVRIINSEFGNYMEEHLSEIDAVVSAANSFGLMDGGLDGAYIGFFGKELEEEVQKKLIEEYYGEQPIGSSMIVDIPKYHGKKLIHTPTMRVPEAILDPRIIYTCMRSSLVMGLKHNIDVILIPAFGHLTGKVDSTIVASLMEKAYKDMINRIEDKSFNTWHDIYQNRFGGFEAELIRFLRI